MLMMTLMTHHFIWVIGLGFAISIAWFIIFSMIQDTIFDGQIGVFSFTWSTADFWFWMVITVAACLLPVLSWNFLQQTYFPSASDLEREKDRLRSAEQSRKPLNDAAPQSDDIELRTRH